MIALCRFCFDEPGGAQAGDRCAHPECPHGGGGDFAATRLVPRTPTRPSLVGGPGAEVVPPAEREDVPHIGTQPSLDPRDPRGHR